MNYDKEKAVFSVEITEGELTVNEKNLTHSKTVELIEMLIEAHPEATRTKEVFESQLASGSLGFIGIYEGEFKFQVSAEIPRYKGAEEHMCPRRGEIPSTYPGKLDSVDRWDIVNGDRVCSFCGSLHPDDLIKLVKEGTATLDPGKPGKIYINRPNVPNAGFGAIKFYGYHFRDEDHFQEFCREYNARNQPKEN